MKLDKRHMAASVCLLVGSIIYNVWVFTRPADSGPAARAEAPFAGNVPQPVATTGETVPAAVDLTQLRPVPDVELDRLPHWARNPFATTRAAQAEVVYVAPPEAEPEPDVVVGAILYSTARRLATVNGRIVRVGDRVGSETVIDIQPDAVVVESQRRGRRTISLRTQAAAGSSGTPRQEPAPRPSQAEEAEPR